MQGLAYAFKTVRTGGMPPWFRTSCAAWCAQASNHQRRRGSRLAVEHMLRAKSAGRHNRAAIWLDLASALYGYIRTEEQAND